MEFLEELKHAWGIKRSDTENIKQRILEAYKDKEYENVIELCSKLNYKKEPLDSEIGYALCYSIWAAPGNDSEAMDIAQKCVEFYDKPKFKEICSYAQEYWANQEIKTIKSFYEGKTRSDKFSIEREHDKKIMDIIESSFNSPLKTYSNALSWNHENDALRDRIKKEIFEAYRTWIEITAKMSGVDAVFEDIAESGEEENWMLNIKNKYAVEDFTLRVFLRRAIEIHEKAIENKHSEAYIITHESLIKRRYFDLSVSYKSSGKSKSKSWKTRPEAIELFESAIYYEKKRNRDGADIKKLIEDVKLKIAEDNNKFGKPLNEFPEASGFCNKLIKAGYTTLGDFLKASEEEIDNISGIGGKTMKEILAFRNKF